METQNTKLNINLIKIFQKDDIPTELVGTEIIHILGVDKKLNLEAIN